MYPDELVLPDRRTWRVAPTNWTEPRRTGQQALLAANIRTDVPPAVSVVEQASAGERGQRADPDEQFDGRRAGADVEGGELDGR